VTDYLTNPATLGMAEGVGMTGMNGTSGFGGPDESPRVSYTLRVNGLERPVNEAWIGESLLYVLRERLGLAGAKGGCDQGECGACSVQLDGQLTAACLVPAALAADSEIRTVEGLSTDGNPSDVQRALAESGAVQCGYCVPGLAMAVHDLLERNHQPTDLQAREALSGNLCRCTGYRGALAAVQTVARSRADEAASGDAASGDETSAGEGAMARPEPAPAPQQASYEQSAHDQASYEEASYEEAAYEEASYEPPEAEPPLYVELPAQQSADPQQQHQSEHYQPEHPSPPQPPVGAEPDPLFGPMDGIAGADAAQVPHPQYAGYPVADHQQPSGTAGTGEYHTGQFPLPVQDYATGQFPVQDYAVEQFPVPDRYPDQHAGPHTDQHTGQFAQPDYATGQFPVPDYPTGDYPTGGYPPAAYPSGDYAAADYPVGEYPVGDYPQDATGYGPGAEADPGVYVLPHQQQHTHTHAPEAGA
jgi:aerobic-type carbon monoxide dehydrogenase small subunit (CoxS/CutS family)